MTASMRGSSPNCCKTTNCARSITETMACGRSKQILLIYVGCEARKLPASGEIFSLDFAFYRTNRDLGKNRIIFGLDVTRNLCRAPVLHFPNLTNSGER